MRTPHLDGVDEVQQDLALVVALHELHVLHDQVGGRPHAPHRQEDVVVQEVAGQPLDLLRQRGGDSSTPHPLAAGLLTRRLHSRRVDIRKAMKMHPGKKQSPSQVERAHRQNAMIFEPTSDGSLMHDNETAGMF